MFIDTHCHLTIFSRQEIETLLVEKDFLLIESIIKKSENAGVKFLLTVGTSLIDSMNCISISKKYKNVFTILGLHPSDCKPDWNKDFDEIKKLIKNKNENKIVGVGETGLDFYHKPYDKERQIDLFKAHIELALENNLALVIHSRDASQELLKVLEVYKKDLKDKAILHCFSHERDFTKILVDWDFSFSINALITYPKNQEIRDIISEIIPVEKILIETDAPFLPPQIYRGKTCFPEYIPIFVSTLAGLKNISVEKLEEITTLNTKKIFNLELV